MKKLILIIIALIIVLTVSAQEVVYVSNAYVEGISTDRGYSYDDDTVYQVAVISIKKDVISVTSDGFFWTDEILATREKVPHICDCGVYTQEYLSWYGKYVVVTMDNEILSIEYLPFGDGTCMNFTYVNQY